MNVEPFEPGFGSTIGEWSSPEWRAYRERVERELDDPDVVGEAGGELRIPWRRDNGDWDRVEDDPELLTGLITAYGPGRFGGPLMRQTESDISLLRALSVVGGWDLIWIWRDLLSRLEVEIGTAKARDDEAAEKRGLALDRESRRARGRRASGSLAVVQRAGITGSAVWVTALNEWWAGSGRAGTWKLAMAPTSVLAWTEVPEEALVGPCVVRWLDPWSQLWNFTAMVNGELRDRTAGVYGGLAFFFHVLTP